MFDAFFRCRHEFGPANRYLSLDRIGDESI